MSYILGIGAFVIWGFCFLFNRKYAPIACLLFIISDYWFGISASFTTATKFMILLTFIFSVGRYVSKSMLLKYWPLFILFCIQAYVVYQNQGGSYTTSAFFTSFFAIVLGFSAFLIPWNERNRYIGLVALAWSSIACVVMGLLQKGALFVDARIVSGTWLPHTPGSLAVVGMFACIILKERYEKVFYQYLLFVNFIIIAAAQVRGMLMCGAVIIIPELCRMFFKMKRSHVLLVVGIIVGGLVVLPDFILPLLERTFTSSGTINSSGRLEAWPFFLELSKDYRGFGMGIGRIKTFENQELVNFPSAHNEYLRFLVETGVVGLLLMLTQFRIFFRNVYSEFILPYQKYYLVFLYIGFAVLAFVENVMTGHLFWVPFCMLLSLSWERENIEG